MVVPGRVLEKLGKFWAADSKFKAEGSCSGYRGMRNGFISACEELDASCKYGLIILGPIELTDCIVVGDK